MPSVLLLAGIPTLAYFGFALFALSQARHWRRVVDNDRPTARQRWLLRGLGFLALILSLALALWRDGPSFGALLWATLLSAAAASVAFTLTWRARYLRPLARAAQAMRNRK